MGTKIALAGLVGALILAFLMEMGSIQTASAECDDIEVLLAKPDKQELAQDELQKLYREYGVTENDIKFAKGELPHYLEGTVLDDKTITMGKITPDGKVSEWTDPLALEYFSKRGYKFIEATRYLEIEREAIDRYIEKYSVNPKNPKVVIVNGVPLPAEYVKELAKAGKLPLENPTKPLKSKLIYEQLKSKLLETKQNAPIGPWAKYGRLYLWILPAADEMHKPTEPYLEDTLSALSRFTQFGVTVYYYHVSRWWSAYDVSPPDSADALLEDLKDDMDWIRLCSNDRDSDNDIVMGWVNYADWDGKAYRNGFFSVGAVTSAWWHFPHDSIAQHEISHNFNADDQGWWPWEHPECIMNYWYAYWGTDKWCISCWKTVYGNVKGLWE